MMSLYPSMKQGVATCMGWDYSALAGANSPAGRENPTKQKAHKRPYTIAGAFFVSAISCYGGCTWAGFGLAGFLLPRFLTPRTVRLQSRENDVGGSIAKGATPMRHILTLNPSKARAAAYKAMAFAALHANSSLSVRLARYNAHMTKARSLGGAQ